MALKLGYGHVDVNGIGIHYYRTGDEKPPIILLHDALDNGLCWNRFPLLLEPTDDVIMIEARGHGFSDAPDEGYRPSDHSNGVYRVIVDLGLKRPIIIGHSMGANTATLLAAQYPELIKSVILEDPPWQIDRTIRSDDDECNTYINEQRDTIINYTKSSLHDLIKVCRNMYPRWDESEYFQWAKARQHVSPNIVSGLGYGQFEWEEIIRNIGCPGLLITADPKLGAFATNEVILQARKIWKKLSIAEIPSAGHNIRRDQPAQFWIVINAYLKSLPRK